MNAYTIKALYIFLILFSFYTLDERAVLLRSIFTKQKNGENFFNDKKNEIFIWGYIKSFPSKYFSYVSSMLRFYTYI